MNNLKQILIDLVQSIKDYEREAHKMIGFDEREAEEFVDIFAEANQLKFDEPSEPEADECNEQAKEFAEKLISNQKDIDPEYVDIVNEHWNELLAND